jgi:hypothetical protein
MESQNNNFANNSEYEKLKSSRFKQQKLPAWRPVPTIGTTIAIFLCFGIVFIIIGIIVLMYSKEIFERTILYAPTPDCPETQKKCYINFEITEDISGKIMFYYQLTNFYQNHRRYVKSKSNDQLLGKDLTIDQIRTDCEPILTNKDLEIANLTSFNNRNIKLKDDDVAFPCGLIAKSFFNDTYVIKPAAAGKPEENPNAPITINENGIAWAADLELKYKLPENKTLWDKMWMNTTDEHFVVWMRPAGLPDFRKLWGRIDGLKKGNYVLEITNNYSTKIFNGTKSVVLSTVNAFGGKNTFLGVSYIVVGGICILMAIGFFIGDRIQKDKNN